MSDVSHSLPRVSSGDTSAAEQLSPVDGRSLVATRVNDGNFITAYTLNELERRISDARIILPICSLGTAPQRLSELGSLVLPPLYHEALTDDLKVRIVERIRQCFPYSDGLRKRTQWQGKLEVVELPRAALPSCPPPRVLAFSVDTAVEEHGPHLPLATDTIQSYAVLDRLADTFDGFVVGPPVDYGMLTWGLAFGLSIDLTAPLTTQYVTGFVNAAMDWLKPESIYVVDVHGSLIHRQAVHAGLKASHCRRHAFRWLYDPLMPFVAERDDFHAGGVETAMIEHIGPELVDARWWPARLEELAAEQMPVPLAVELSQDLSKFIEHVESRPLNGIVANIRNYFQVDAALMLESMLAIAQDDVQQLVDSCSD